MSADILTRLENDKPQFHWGGTQRWDAAPETLRDIQRSVRKDMRTLETGCGVSTIIFASQGSHHTTVSPTKDEQQRVVDYLQSIDIDTSRLHFEVGFSDDVLPAICSYRERMAQWDAWFTSHLDSNSLTSVKASDLWREQNTRDLDYIFLDGAHSFPYPLIDWHYSIRRLKTGGHLVLDDVPIPAVACVYRYMITDPCWKLVGISDNRAAKFQLVSLPAPEDSALQLYNRLPDYGFLPLHKRASMHVSYQLNQLRRQVGERMPGVRDYWRRMRQ